MPPEIVPPQADRLLRFLSFNCPNRSEPVLVRPAAVHLRVAVDPDGGYYARVIVDCSRCEDIHELLRDIYDPLGTAGAP